MTSSSFFAPRWMEIRWIKDFIFCTAAYFILLSMFTNAAEWQMIDHLYTSIFLGTLILFGAINEMLIQKHFLNRKNYGLFVTLTTFNILAGAFFNYILFDKLIDIVLPQYYFISYYEYADLIKFFFVYIFLLTLLSLSWEWFHLQEARHRLATLEKEKISAELKALTNQVNPHFLFNSLTVLYGLALKNSSETANAVIKLSDTLRYVIYESARGKVTLASEIELINNYLELQRFRVKNASSISFTHDVQNPKLEIEPMLFLPLIENSFKHGILGDGDYGFVKIDLFSANADVSIRVTNNKGIAPASHETGGIGLKNIEERLKLLYHAKFHLAIEETESIFTVNLRLKTA
jgi:hypothetical protein